MENTITFAREDQFQAYCAQWFWNTYHQHRRMLVMIDNNSHNAIEGNKKKAMGVVPGPSDFILFVEGAVICIELKLPGKTQQNEQIDFMNKVKDRGHVYIIIYTFEQFKQFICQVIGK